MPEPVKRYAAFSCILGSEAIKWAHLKHEGVFRTAPDQAFLPIAGEEFFITDPPGFIWKGSLKMSGIPVVVRDRYWKEEGNMLVQAFWTIPLENATGVEIAKSSLIRYLMEAVWIPSAFLEDNIRWTPIDKNTAKATISDGKLSASVTFYFNEEGAIIKAISNERFMTVEDKYLNYPWIGTMGSYSEMNGFNVPTETDVAWEIEGEKFTYAKFKVKEIDFSGYSEFSP